MPLEQAVYSASRNRIYAVRGGYIYDLNATTGALISSAVVAQPTFGNSCIAYDSVTDKLFVTHWNSQKWDDSGSANYDTSIYKRIYKISPATLAVDASSYITDVAPWAVQFTRPFCGPHQVICHSGLLYVLFVNLQNTIGLNLYVITIDPVTLAISDYDDKSSNYANNGWIDMCIQPASGPNNAQLWLTTSASATTPYDTSDLEYGSSPYYEVVTTTAFGAAPFPVGYGICWAANVGQIFSTTRSQRVIYFTPSTSSPAPAATFNTGDATATPYRCRYCDEAANPFYGYVLIPGLASNTVSVVNTTTLVTTLKTGFDSPLDVVFTPSKAFAVQLGAVGLKEITF